MTTTASTAPAQEKNEGKGRPLILAGAAFAVAAVTGFLFLHNPAHETRHGAEQRHASADSVARFSGTKKADQGVAQVELQRERLLESVGSVSAIQLYQSYLNVGLLADAVRNQSYTKEEAADILNTIVPLMQTVDAQMRKLEDIDLDQDEAAAVKEVRRISGMISLQAEHLKAYWKTGDKTSLESFQGVRRESWVELRTILGLAGQNPAKAD